MEWCDGSGYYEYFRAIRVEPQFTEDFDDITAWIPGPRVNYSKGQLVVVQDVSETATTTLQLLYRYLCTEAHESLGESDGPVRNANGYWQADGVLSVALNVTPITPPTVSQTDEPDEEALPEPIQHTIHMNCLLYTSPSPRDS